VIDLDPAGAKVIEIVAGLTFNELQKLTAVTLINAC
jgi:3-oxoadipate CoA-transferase beta subunit